MTRSQQVLHWAIVLILGTGFLSALFMVFVVYRPEGHAGPLWMSARELPHEFIVQRRLYALEAWVTFGFLSVYLALTSLRPARDPSRDG
jgi:hypothetical protein